MLQLKLFSREISDVTILLNFDIFKKKRQKGNISTFCFKFFWLVPSFGPFRLMEFPCSNLIHQPLYSLSTHLGQIF